MTIEEMKCPNCSAPLSRRGADWYCPFCGGAYRENGAEKPPSPPADRQGDPPPDSRAEAPYRGAEILACAQGKDVPLRAGNTAVRAVPMRFDRSQAISILRQAAPKGAIKACFSISALQAVREVRLPLWRIACRGIAAMEGIWAERPHFPPPLGAGWPRTVSSLPRSCSIPLWPPPSFCAVTCNKRLSVIWKSRAGGRFWGTPPSPEMSAGGNRPNGSCKNAFPARSVGGVLKVAFGTASPSPSPKRWPISTSPPIGAWKGRGRGNPTGCWSMAVPAG